MKSKFALILFVLFLGASSVADAKDVKNIRKPASVTVELPPEVLSAQGHDVFKPAYQKLVKVFDGIPHHERKNIVLMAYEAGEGSDHYTHVKLTYGTTTDMWPTRVYEIGSIKMKLRMFPDGIMGYEAVGEAEFLKPAP